MIDKTLPKETDRKSYRVTGMANDEDLARVVVQPGNVAAQVTANRFTATVILSSGPNTIEAIAYDAAGHEGSDTFDVSLVEEGTLGAEPEREVVQVEATPEAILEWRRKYDELQKKYDELLANKQVRVLTPVVQRVEEERYVAIPPGKALFFAPYNMGRGDTLYELARHYLDNPMAFPQIAEFNDDAPPEVIRKNRRVLVPTRGLLSMLAESAHEDVAQIVVDVTGESVNVVGPGRGVSLYRAAIVEEMRKLGHVPPGTPPEARAFVVKEKALVRVEKDVDPAVERREIATEIARRGLRVGYLVNVRSRRVDYLEVTR
jgi:hypothetical protein